MDSQVKKGGRGRPFPLLNTGERACASCKKLTTDFALRNERGREGRLQRNICRDCYNRNERELRAALKKRVFDHYGWRCVCCGEDNPTFLTMDHKNNDGYLDKFPCGTKKVGKDLYHQVIKEGFPDRFQTLCHNCNFGKKVNGGVCPHQTQG